MPGHDGGLPDDRHNGLVIELGVINVADWWRLMDAEMLTAAKRPRLRRLRTIASQAPVGRRCPAGPRSRF